MMMKEAEGEQDPSRISSLENALVRKTHSIGVTFWN
jgi:hypothetical protein